MFAGYDGLTEDFNKAKSLFEGAKSKVSQFVASPTTTGKYNDLEKRKVQIMISGGPDGGQVDDAAINKWISEAKSVVNDINSLYKTYVVPRLAAPSTGAVISSPPVPFGAGDKIFGLPKMVVYGLGGLLVVGLITFILPKKSSAPVVTGA